MSRKSWFPPCFLLFLGLVFAFHPTLFSGFGRIQTDPGDLRFCNYILEHGYRWALRYPMHLKFWNAPFFYPVENVSAYSETLLGSAPIYWFWRLIQFPADTAFQLWMISLSSLNFLSMFLLLKSGMRLSSWSSSIGSFIFAFGASRIVQLEHPQLFPHFFTPVALYALIRTYQARSEIAGYKWVALFFLSTAGQIYASFYLGWFTLLLFCVLTCVALCFEDTKEQLLKKAFLHKVSIMKWAVISAVWLVPMASHYLGAGKQVGFRSVENLSEPKLQSWFYVGSNSWLYFWHEWIQFFKVVSSDEHRVGIGLVTLALSVKGLWSLRKQPWMRVFTLSFFILFICVTRFYKEAFIWPIFFHLIPGANAIRVLSRIALVFLIPAAVGLASFVQKNKNWKYIVMLCAFCILEQGRTTDSYDKQTYRNQVTALVKKIDPSCSSFLYMPVSTQMRESLFDLDAMWASLEVSKEGIPTLNGYSGWVPPGWRQGDTQHWLHQWAERHKLDPRKICWVE